MKPSTEKVVARIVDDYRSAGRTIAKAQRRRAQQMDMMDSDTFDADADAIQAAYDQGKFDTVPESELPSMMEKYGATDIYHLTASYFNATGKILNVE